MTASVASMLDNFNRGNIDMLLKMGYKVTLAANFSGKEDSSPPSRLRHFQAEMEAKGCRVVQIDFSRKIGNFPKQLKSYRQLRELAKEGFDLVHCNSPICSALTRLAFRKYRKYRKKGSPLNLDCGGTEQESERNRREDEQESERNQHRPEQESGYRKSGYRKSHGTRVIYTAHGFHFFRGAPAKNWIFYFPVEWVCAHWTDILNTINEEDYRFAKRWLKAGQVVRLPGVGIDLEKFKPRSAERTSVRMDSSHHPDAECGLELMSENEASHDTRRESYCETLRSNLGIGPDEKMLLSVGELSRRKNQGSVIRALALMKDEIKLRYVICGQGEMAEEYRTLARKLGLADKVIFTGYREDIAALCQTADLFVFPSLQEGMPMALMEAMAAGTPVICSDIRGNRELVSERELRFDPRDVSDVARCIIRVLVEDHPQNVERHYERLAAYRSENVKKIMSREYLTIVSEGG